MNLSKILATTAIFTVVLASAPAKAVTINDNNSQGASTAGSGAVTRNSADVNAIPGSGSDLNTPVSGGSKQTDTDPYASPKEENSLTQIGNGNKSGKVTVRRGSHSKVQDNIRTQE